MILIWVVIKISIKVELEKILIIDIMKTMKT